MHETVDAVVDLALFGLLAGAIYLIVSPWVRLALRRARGRR
jgi:hypothetical protein